MSAGAAKVYSRDGHVYTREECIRNRKLAMNAARYWKRDGRGRDYYLHDVRNARAWSKIIRTVLAVHS